MEAEMTEIVMPSDANHMGTCFGGKIMQWIDICAALAACRLHRTTEVVTASVDSIQFKRPAMVGDIITLKARVNRTFRKSMEVGVTVLVEHRGYLETEGSDFMGEPRYEKHIHPPEQACSAYLTFVPVMNGKPVRVDGEVEIKTRDDHRRYEEAGGRKSVRLYERENK